MAGQRDRAGLCWVNELAVAASGAVANPPVLFNPPNDVANLHLLEKPSLVERGTRRRYASAPVVNLTSPHPASRTYRPNTPAGHGKVAPQIGEHDEGPLDRISTRLCFRSPGK